MRDDTKELMSGGDASSSGLQTPPRRPSRQLMRASIDFDHDGQRHGQQRGQLHVNTSMTHVDQWSMVPSPSSSSSTPAAATASPPHTTVAPPTTATQPPPTSHHHHTPITCTTNLATTAAGGVGSPLQRERARLKTREQRRQLCVQVQQETAATSCGGEEGLVCGYADSSSSSGSGDDGDSVTSFVLGQHGGEPMLSANRCVVWMQGASMCSFICRPRMMVKF